jgi:hypothetical protein
MVGQVSAKDAQSEVRNDAKIMETVVGCFSKTGFPDSRLDDMP